VEQPKHPFDVVAEQLEAAANQPVIAQDASPDWWELSFAADETVGDYPQALLPESHDWGGSDGLGPDGFPAVAIPEQHLQSTAHWTDVLSSSLWSEGYLLNEKALAVFKQSNLGEFREYPAIVRDHAGSPRPLTYLYVRNQIQPEAIDFERSEFYLADMLNQPIRAVVVNSFEEREEKRRMANEGKLDGCKRFSRIEYKRLYFMPGHRPAVDLFSLARLSIRVYISARLRNAIVESGITGLEIRPNKRLFAGD
jgi:hypothetical protein